MGCADSRPPNQNHPNNTTDSKLYQSANQNPKKLLTQY